MTTNPNPNPNPDPTPAPTATPETDAAIVFCDLMTGGNRDESTYGDMVPADFARSLETRLAASNAEAEGLRKERDEAVEEMCAVRPFADCYKRVCETLGIESDILGFVATLTAENARLAGEVETEKRGRPSHYDEICAAMSLLEDERCTPENCNIVAGIKAMSARIAELEADGRRFTVFEKLKLEFANYNRSTEMWDVVGAAGCFHGHTLRAAIDAAAPQPTEARP